MTRPTMSELDTESGKRRCSVRSRVKRRVEVEPEPAEPDAAKARFAGSRRDLEAEPDNAANRKGRAASGAVEPARADEGVVRC